MERRQIDSLKSFYVSTGSGQADHQCDCWAAAVTERSADSLWTPLQVWQVELRSAAWVPAHPSGLMGLDGERRTEREFMTLTFTLMLQLHSFKTLSASKPSGEKTPTTLRKLKLQIHLTPSTQTLQRNSKYPHVLHFQTKTWREEELAWLKDPETIDVTVPPNSVRQSL